MTNRQIVLDLTYHGERDQKESTRSNGGSREEVQNTFREIDFIAIVLEQAWKKAIGEAIVSVRCSVTSHHSWEQWMSGGQMELRAGIEEAAMTASCGLLSAFAAAAIAVRIAN